MKAIANSNPENAIINAKGNKAKKKNIIPDHITKQHIKKPDFLYVHSPPYTGCMPTYPTPIIYPTIF